MVKVEEIWLKSLGAINVYVDRIQNVGELRKWLRSTIDEFKEFEDTTKISEVYLNQDQMQITFGEEGLFLQPVD